MNYLRSKFGRRMVLLFVCCAFVPVAVLTFVAFSHVRQQLNEQSQRRLFQATKNLGMTIYERLLFLEAEIGFVAVGFSKGNLHDGKADLQKFGRNFAPRFSGLVIKSERNGVISLLRNIEALPDYTTAELQHLRTGKTLISSQYNETLPARVFMSRAVIPLEPERGILVGEINFPYVLGIGDASALLPLTELCLLDQYARKLICSNEGSGASEEPVISALGRSQSHQFQWSQDGEEYVASSWVIPMKFKFFHPQWTVVLSERKSDVFAPMSDFTRIFPFVVLLSLLVILLLSVRQIRRSVVPLERLKAGTRRIARRDFTSPVKVKSGDEFEELAESFNAMAARLGRQFETLATMAEIDRAILSSLDTDKIVETVLAQLRDVFPSKFVSVTLLDEDHVGNARIYTSDDHGGKEILIREVHGVTDDVMTLLRNGGGICLADGKVPEPLVEYLKPGIQSLMVLPILRKEGLSGWMSLGHVRSGCYSEEDMIQVRQLADQVAVALSNASYIEERRRAKDELQDNLQRLVALRDIDQAVTSTLDLNTILDFLLRKIDLLVPDSATSVWLVQKAHETPMPVAQRNLNAANWYKEELAGWGGAPNPVFETRAMAHVRNLQNRDGLQHQEFFHNNNLVTYLGVPLIAKGEFLGALSVYLKEDHAFTGEEVDFFSTLAGQVAIAIYNARLYEEVKMQAESLARANRVKCEFLSVMSHELRTPLTIIMSFTESLQEGIFGALTEKQKESLKKVSKQSNHLLTMINTLMETT
ncbi:MAG: GAF domain-containing protein, partial [Deltaproteobacteria bacterium]|nr:GAF domain-containing protein [Deltaproteobacteria bacterium]